MFFIRGVKRSSPPETAYGNGRLGGLRRPLISLFGNTPLPLNAKGSCYLNVIFVLPQYFKNSFV